MNYENVRIRFGHSFYLLYDMHLFFIITLTWPGYVCLPVYLTWMIMVTDVGGGKTGEAEKFSTARPYHVCTCTEQRVFFRFVCLNLKKAIK
uniref:Uncharacterized protein n=1 Tax=Anguilla anguilla TaxID=7936 RepID=A0A0E9Y1A1_ANGAN